MSILTLSAKAVVNTNGDKTITAVIMSITDANGKLVPNLQIHNFNFDGLFYGQGDDHNAPPFHIVYHFGIKFANPQENGFYFIELSKNLPALGEQYPLVGTILQISVTIEGLAVKGPDGIPLPGGNIISSGYTTARVEEVNW